MGEKNVLGTELKACCFEPKTGYYRDGYCKTGAEDIGTHVVCAIMTDAFLRFTRSRGNDLITPLPYFQFPGLKAGDKWCLCVSRWKEAFVEGLAPPVILEGTHEKALDYVSFESLLEHKYTPKQSEH
ncbi:MAG: DUF2237 domain-containing protein [Bacteroidota bacterium]